MDLVVAVLPGLLLLLHEAAEPRGLEAVGDAGDARVREEILRADGPLGYRGRAGGGAGGRLRALM
jgi:hypothetical protein